MMLLEKQQKMREAVQQAVEAHLETSQGECIAYDEESGDEWGFKWRDGEARIYDECEDEESGEDCDFVFCVRVELVGVDPA